MAKHLALVVAILFIPALAKADSVWTYQGNAVSVPTFSPCVGTCLQSISGDGAMTGTVLLNNDNQVEAWSFTGPTLAALTNFNTIDASFNLFNCASCSTPFQGWSISMFKPSLGPGGDAQFPYAVEMFSFWNPDTGIGQDYMNNHNGGLGQVYVTNNPGVWTEVVFTPEPSSLVSLLSGLAALGLIICRWKTQRVLPAS